MSQALSSYKYSYWTLQDQDWIRLLVLFPATDLTAPIQCSLLHRPIDASSNYEALSYTWGVEPAILSINIDGASFQIRKNLEGALRRLRLANTPRTLWIDAICINQGDTKERGLQVSQMRNIYANAAEVAVWLGDGTHWSDAGMDYMSGILTLAENIMAERSSTSRLDDSLSRIASALKVELARPNSDNSLVGLVSILTKPWWLRVWIIQEIGLAREAVVYCGSKQLPWKHFEAFADLLSIEPIHNTFIDHGPKTKNGMLAIALLRNKYSRPITLGDIRKGQTAGTLTLSTILKRTINYLATDPRDKVYAVLGLLPQKPNIQIRYDGLWTASMAYTEATKVVLLEDGNLSIFAGILGSGEQRNEDLPSWVPDYYAAAEGRKCATVSAGDDRLPLVFCASAMHGLTLARASVGFEGNRILILSGLSIDEISVLGEPAAKMDEAEFKDQSHSMYYTVTCWKQLLSKIDKDLYVSGGTKLEAFWRTVTLDQKILGFHPRFRVNLRGREKRLDGADKDLSPLTLVEEKSLCTALDQSRGGIGGGHIFRRLFVTPRGCIGLAPPIAEVGDIICVLLGGEVPYVLRPLTGGYFKLIGECYTHGIMDGEAIREVGEGKRSYRSFKLT